MRWRVIYPVFTSDRRARKYRGNSVRGVAFTDSVLRVGVKITVHGSNLCLDRKGESRRFGRGGARVRGVAFTTVKEIKGFAVPDALL